MDPRKVVYLSELFLLFAVISRAVNAECDETSEVFPELAEAQYGQVYADINSGQRPLGFKKYVVHYMDPPQPVCVKVEDVTGRGVEVMFETIPNAVLCYRDNVGNANCGDPSGKLQLCNWAPEGVDTIYYDFYYDISNGGGNSDVKFWLRITKGMDDDQDLAWCHNRDNRFPSSLLIGSVPIPPEPTEKASSATAIKCTIILVMSAILSSIVFS